MLSPCVHKALAFFRVMWQYDGIMKSLTVTKNEDGMRLDRYLMRACPSLGMSEAQKYIRLKHVKIGGKRVSQPNAHLSAGDQVDIYLGDQYFVAPSKPDALLSKFRVRIHVLYEDEHILLVDKRPGLIVHPDDGEKVDTLVTHVRAYLYQKGEYDSMAPQSFSPTPVNRIDRFTGGIVIVAKTREAMAVLSRKIRDGEVDKHYLCAALGRLRPERGTFDNYIVKNTKRVTVLERSAPGAQRAITRYNTLTHTGRISLVDCLLLTGRTHQIRAQFAHAGHPLIGDNQYGDPAVNKKLSAYQQALYAYRVTFSFAEDAGVLHYLSGQSFSVSQVPFVHTHFPDYRITE